MMSGEAITPVLGENSFSCPHCGAVAHQTWYDLFLNAYKKDNSPWIPDDGMLERFERDLPKGGDSILEYFKKKHSKKLFCENHTEGSWLKDQLDNSFVSECYSCGRYSLWVADNLVYPQRTYTVMPAADMPDDVRADFLEAASIVGN